jgi:hypothetical protein
MKRCVFVLSLTSMLCLLGPTAAEAIVAQTAYAHSPAKAHTAVRKAPKPPRRDQVQNGELSGSLALIQFISTRRSHDERHQDQVAPQNGFAQVLASRDDAGRSSPATLIARAVETLPPHRGATHLSI